MVDRFKGKYRIPSARLPEWNYGWDASYFVTICTANHECFFGKVEDDLVILSDVGEMVRNFGVEIPLHFPFVLLGEYVVMPNHLHGIITICRDSMITVSNNDFENAKVKQSSSMGTVLDDNTFLEYGKLAKWQSGNFGVIVNHFKRICTINARKVEPLFSWQSRYYDHVIRTVEAYQKIENYINTNPVRWSKDKYFG